MVFKYLGFVALVYLGLYGDMVPAQFNSFSNDICVFVVWSQQIQFQLADRNSGNLIN